MSEYRCQSCRQLLPNEPVQEELPPPRTYVKLSPDWFRDLCFVLLKHATCHERFHGALKDLPKSVDQWGRLTEKQWKLFAFIHHETLGAWPNKPPQDAPKEAASKDLPADYIPF